MSFKYENLPKRGDEKKGSKIPIHVYVRENFQIRDEFCSMKNYQNVLTRKKDQKFQYECIITIINNIIIKGDFINLLI